MTEVEKALFEGQVSGLAVTFYQNERPLYGLAGQLDWRFHGAISYHIRKGVISGAVGECVYFPFTRRGSTYHIILTGGGLADHPGQRDALPIESLHALQKNLSSLGLTKIGISKADFGNITPELLTKHLKGVPLWIGP
jgi:hypothetical protein